MFGELYTSGAFGCGLNVPRQGLGTPSAALANTVLALYGQGSQKHSTPPVPLLLRVHFFKPGYYLAMARFGHDLDKTELFSYVY